MRKIRGINPEKISLNCIAFDLDSVLSGEAANQDALELLENLLLLERGAPSFSLALVSGYSDSEGWKKLAESGFEKFFLRENVFFAGKEYVDSMLEVDRQRYLEKIGNNAFFQDDYFKQAALKKIAESRGIPASRVLLVGHDLLTDAYYSQRFSGAKVALVKRSLSFRHEPSKQAVRGLWLVSLCWKDFKKILLGKMPEEDLSFLKRFVETFLSRELVGGIETAAGLLGRAKLAEKQKQGS